MRALFLLLASLVTAAAWAQPYVAGGGFDRPWQVGEVSVTSRLALAGDGDGAVVYWSDANGVLASPLDASESPERIFEGRGIRELAAAEVDGDPAVAWAQRGLTSARSTHTVLWRGEERMLLEAAQPYPMAVVETTEGPGVLYSSLREGSHRLRLIGWNGSETLIRRSDENIAKYRGHAREDGSLVVVWLEGQTQREAVGGPVSDWSAYMTQVSADGEPSEPVLLGAARNLGIESSTAAGTVGGQAAALWPGMDGEVMFATAGSEPRAIAFGSPVAITDGLTYWTAGESILRIDPFEEGQPVSVAWSPVNVERAELVGSEDAAFLAWTGPAQGGNFVVYASDSREPFQPGWQDHVAAAMDWSPWAFWEAFVGQLLGALFAGLLISMALAPLLWLGSLLALRLRWVGAGTWSGIAMGAIVLLLIIALAASRSSLAESFTQLFGTVPQLIGSLAVAALITWLIRRRNDSEEMLGTMASGWLFLFVSISALAFLTLQSWLGFWSNLA